MQMERERGHSNGNGNGNYLYNYNYNYSSSSSFCNDYNEVDQGVRHRDNKSPIMSSSSSSSSSPSPSKLLPISSSALGFIEHPVSKFDTLAGVAIKYGVEVADIKKMNGLITDRQMFALKSLQIPLPGRHPPSPCLASSSDTPGQSCSEQTPPHHVHCDLLDSFQSLRLKSSQREVSPAMSTLQGYYGLKPRDLKTTSEGFEMAIYRKGGAHYLEDGPFLEPSPDSNPSLSQHRKSRSLANGFANENGDTADNTLTAEAGEGDSDKWNEKLVRRRQKSVADFTSCTPEMLMKEDNGSGSGFSAIKGKGLALRTKAVSRASLGADAEAGGLNPIPIGLGDSVVVDGFSAVRKSSSTSSLHDQDTSISSLWPTSKWNLKQDLQALSTAAITRPIFDGLPKPVTGRKNKAALD